MAPIIRLVGGGEPHGDKPPTPTVSVSLEHAKIVLASLRKQLPALKAQLRRRWPSVNEVQIEYALPTRLKNPIDAATVRAFLAEIGHDALRLVVIFGAGFAGRAGMALGKEAMTPPAKEVGKFLCQWVERLTKRKPKKKSRKSKGRKRARS